MRELDADIVIVGGGTGGTAAALAAARLGRRVVITEPTGWLGGQMTSQAVPPDEHRWIEQFGCTRSWRRFRNGVRACFRDNFPLRGETLANPPADLGGALVSRIACPPGVALSAIEQMLLPEKIAGRIVPLHFRRPVAAETEGDRVTAVTVEDTRSGERIQLTARYFLDASEGGDLLPLAGVEHVSGRESRDQTGEPHATEDADPHDIQAITWCFAIDHLPGEDHTIERPVDYEFWRTYVPDGWPDRLLSWRAPDPENPSRPRTMSLFEEAELPLWRFRRLIEKRQLVPGAVESDITLVNWPQNDYFLGPILGVDEREAAWHGRGARQLSLSLLYWLQTEAPRPDDGHGYPGLRLRGDLMGTEDGLAMAPYIRESRRIRAQRTIVEQDVVRDRGAGFRTEDSVGIGSYPIDLHPSTGRRNYLELPTLPFEIPLGALIPVRVENLLPAAKNIGTTHITNGCYRLHPVEWNIGEAAGSLAAHCLDHRLTPHQVRASEPRLREFQRLLAAQGVELHWPTLDSH